jgi:pyridoxal phosphate enzyme (YggS family)
MDTSGLTEVEERIAAAAGQSGRSDPIRLVVVVKYASDADVARVVAAGATDLGENRADALVKRSDQFGDVTWHFVGRVQGNKARLIRPATQLLHSMDRSNLVGYWSKGDPVSPPVLVQVNVAGEPQKAGVTPDEVPRIIEQCVVAGIEVRGLMTVPPRPDLGTDSVRWFAALRQLRDDVRNDHPGVNELSMGMTDDFEVAIGEGATILRVGRAIFDPSRNEG